MAAATATATPLRHLDLFSGIGGFALAAQMVGGIETRQFVEIEPYCQRLLGQRFPGVPIHNDVKTLQPQVNQYDLITAGFPCQDISSANANGRGLEGERSGLFYEVVRIIRECQPSVVVLENVAALLSRDKGKVMGTVLWELSKIGFDAEWQVVSAASVGAPHLRKRVFIVAYRSSLRQSSRGEGLPHNSNEKAGVGAASERGEDRLLTPLLEPVAWSSEPGSLRMDNGVPNGVDRIKGLGNAVVPQAAAIALRRAVAVAEATRHG